MAVSKLSQILTVGSNPLSTDFVVGTTSTNTVDSRISFTQATQALTLFSSSLQGVVPSSGGGTANFLRADGTWATPVATAVGITVGTTSVLSGTSGNFLYNNSSVLGERTPTQATAVLNVFTSALQGLVPASGGGTSNFLRADGTWTTTGGGGTPGGSSGQIQYDNSGSFGGIPSWTNASSITALGNTTTAQQFLVYNTVDTISGPTNYERATFDWTTTSNVLTIGTQKGGTGSTRNLQFVVGGTNQLDYGVSNAGEWTMTQASTGGFIASNFSWGFVQNSNGAGVLTFEVSGGAAIGWPSGGIGGISDTTLARRGAAGTLGLTNMGTGGACTFQVYNVSDAAVGAPTNYERGALDWNNLAGTLTIATQAGGTGNSRDILISPASGALYFGAGSGSTQREMQYFGGDGFVAGNLSGYFFSANHNPPSGIAAGFGYVTTNVVGMTNSPGGSIAGWMNWAGEQRTTAATTYTSNTTLSTILTANVQAGRTYSFEIYIPVTASLSTGGVKVALAGTATVTNMIADGSIRSNNAIVGQAQVTSLTTVVSAVGGAATGYAEIHGTITVNAAGTFLVQTAQNTSSATSTVIGQGARLIMEDMP